MGRSIGRTRSFYREPSFSRTSGQSLPDRTKGGPFESSQRFENPNNGSPNSPRRYSYFPRQLSFFL
jgi:hypothetical protein